MQARHRRQFPATAAADGPGDAHEEAAPHGGGEAHQGAVEQAGGDGSNRHAAQAQAAEQGFDGSHHQGYLQARHHQDVDGATFGEHAEMGLIRRGDAQGEGAPEILGGGPQRQGLEAVQGEGLQPQQQRGFGGADDFHQLSGRQLDPAGRFVAASAPKGPFDQEDRCRLDGPQIGSQPDGRTGFGGWLFAVGGHGEGQGEAPHGFRRRKVEPAPQPLALEGPRCGDPAFHGLKTRG